jgi:type IX secretion system PorP/SprF family membrane protein
MHNPVRVKMLVALLLLTLLGVGGNTVQAQQDKMFSQYMFNTMALNPAYAGSRDVLSATALYRAQWVGIEGAPRTATFTADMPLRSERVGVGIQLYNDQVGVFNETGAFASYAFRFRVGEKSTISLGVQGGAANYNIKLSTVQTAPTGTGQVDPAFTSDVNEWLPNFGTGIYVSNDRSYFGVSVPRLLKNNLTRYSDGASSRATERRHVYTMAGFVVNLTSVLKLKPSFLVKYVDGAPLGIDGNLNLWLNDRIAIGTSFRKNNYNSWANFSNDAIVALLELQLTDQFRLGYAYDRTLNRLQGFGPNSHEVMLRYEFGFGKSKILTPRYF